MLRQASMVIPAAASSSRTGSAANGPPPRIGDCGAIERERPIEGCAIAYEGSLAADPSSGITDRHDADGYRPTGPAGPATRLLGAAAEIPLVAVLPTE